jgi:hypothetical protein
MASQLLWKGIGRCSHGLRAAAVLWKLGAVVDWDELRCVHASRGDGGRFSAHGLGDRLVQVLFLTPRIVHGFTLKLSTRLQRLGWVEKPEVHENDGSIAWPDGQRRLKPNPPKMMRRMTMMSSISMGFPSFALRLRSWSRPREDGNPLRSQCGVRC